ncbi:hypothetical protein QQ008_12195 [Fulvivirgaceae bacterium BMA10]|uniref:DoxX family protein n=1 Tax=Splendidivirga corallicola TaxID=3051826 RepID=A0ABT8KN26_9BACT|nr:hypothetical protein [Fulvivirgaceae bacterium BMA10]
MTRISIEKVNNDIKTDLMHWVKWLLRIGLSATFLGHGIIAFKGNEHWLSYLDTVGLEGALALKAMLVIGVLDIVIAVSVLIKPVKYVLYWCVFWTLATALIRPLSGESILQFVERGSNWTVPLVLLLLMHISKQK